MAKRIRESDNIPQVPIHTITLDRFKGVDLSSSIVNVDPARSPDAPNMMPSEDGFPVKRPGWKTQMQLQGQVHGAHALVKDGKTHQLIHAGTTMYKVSQTAENTWNAQVIGSDMNDAPSVGVQLSGKLWILDGKTYRCFDGETLRPVSEIATIPKITIAKSPNGKNGATSYLPVNLLTGFRTDSYAGLEATAAETDYYLSFNELTASKVTAKKLQSDGIWTDLTEGSDFSVDRKIGKVKFKTPPGKSPVDGEDNIQITYEVASKAEQINKCSICILYGIGGALDRIFVAGNPDEVNVDHWSAWNDPAFIGDLSYGTIGSAQSAIVGYSILADTLVTHKNNEENGRNAFVRKGVSNEDGDAEFRITNVIQGQGAIAPRCFASLNSEPLFLTEQGIYALTPSDITGERYAQERSWFINAQLCRETALRTACACVWGRFYVLCTDSAVYLLDGAQKSYASKSPYATFQYEAYYWPGIHAVSVWVQDSKLWFGTADGRLCAFCKGTQQDDYSDDGKPIEAHWCTPLMNLGTWSSLKTVTHVWITGKPYTRSGGEIYYITNKDWEKLGRSYNIDIFDWNDIDFDRFTFSSWDGPQVVPLRKKAKKIQVFQLKIENKRMNEPFGLFAVTINYRVGGYVKK